MAKFEQGSAPAIRNKRVDGKRVNVWTFVHRKLETDDQDRFEELAEAGAVMIEGELAENPHFEFPFDVEELTKSEIAEYMGDCHEFDLSVNQTKAEMLEEIKDFFNENEG